MEKILSKFPGDATSWGLEKEYAFPELFEEGLPTDMSTFQQMCCALSPCEPEHHHLSPVSEHLDLSHHPESVKFQYWVACCRMNGRPFPAAELLRCPLIWCRNYFNNRDELTQHVKDCSYLDDGEYWCPKCEKRERFAFHPTYEEWKPHRAQIPFGLCIFRKALRTFRAWAKGSAKFIELDALMPASENELELLIDRPYRLPQIASSREFSVLSGIPVSELTGNPIIFPELSVERMSTSGIDLSTPGAYELENLPIKDNQFYYSESDTDGVQSPQRFSSNYFTARGESPSLDLGESHFALEHHQHVGNLPQDFTKVEAKANSQDRHQWSEAEIRAALNQSAGFHQGPLSLQTFDTLQRNVFLQVLKQLSHILHHDTMRKLRSLPNSSYASSLLRAGAWSSADSLLDGGFTVIKAILRNEFPTTLSEVMMFSFLVFTIAVVSDQESLFSGDLYDNLSSWRLVITSDMDKANFLRAIRDLWPPQDKATYHRPSIFTPMSVENEFVNTTYAPAYCASTNFSPLFVIPEVPLGQVAENTGQTSSSLSTGDPGDFHTSLKQGLAMRTVCSFMETLMFYDLEKKIAFHPKNQAENSVGGCDFTRLIIRFVTSPLLALDGLEAFQPVVRKAEEKLQSGVLDNIHDVRIYLLQDAFKPELRNRYRHYRRSPPLRKLLGLTIKSMNLQGIPID
ncbi:MAG: hypothetical protein MMC33_000609 [Icmadophila ericetorum]|nr:hypothetical protein [Icmadophila ericetorum]